VLRRSYERPGRHRRIAATPLLDQILADGAAAARFAALAAIFWFRLGSGDPSRIPSALIGRPAPQTALPPLAGLVNNGAQVPGLDPLFSRARSASSMSGPRGACPATTKRRF
jgi:hypothetical protein